jgi:nucleotide-binding universal stress UspA family protein
MTTSISNDAVPEVGKHQIDALQIKGILVATDFSEQATLATKIAARLARQIHSRLYVLYVESPQVYAPGAGVLVPLLQAAGVEVARKQLHKYIAGIPEVRSTKHEEIVSSGLVLAAIYEAIESKGIDLVVVGSHGRAGLRKVMLGSVAEAAVRQLHCPVLVIGPDCVLPFHRLKSVLFVTGLSSEATEAAKYAIWIARRTGATLTVAHVLPGDLNPNDVLGFARWENAAHGMRELIANALSPRQVHFEILTGVTAEEILNIARKRKTGLIVMGRKEAGTVAGHVPWATLSYVIRGACCPVLGIPSHE